MSQLSSPVSSPRSSYHPLKNVIIGIFTSFGISMTTLAIIIIVLYILTRKIIGYQSDSSQNNLTIY